MIFRYFGSGGSKEVGYRSEVTLPYIFGVQGVQLGSLVSAEEIVKNDFQDEI